MKVQVTSRHFRSRIDYLPGTRDRQLSLNVIVNGVPVRLGKGALDERIGQRALDRQAKITTRWDNEVGQASQRQTTTRNEVGQASQDHDWCEGSQVSNCPFFKKCGTVSGNV
jgi:hypothetical protein